MVRVLRKLIFSSEEDLLNGQKISKRDGTVEEKVLNRKVSNCYSEFRRKL